MWALRMILMLMVGVIPAILLVLVLLMMLIVMAPAFDFIGGWFIVMIVLAVLGVIGLWGATFQTEQERALPTGITVALLLCGLLGAGPMFIDMVPTALTEGGLTAWLVVLLLGPVTCSVYFLVERLVMLAVPRKNAGAEP